jgi:membrane AbrB-like protein
VLQDLRVLFVIATTPLIAAVVFGLTAGDAPRLEEHGEHVLAGLRLIAIALVIGIPAARLLRLPAGGLIGPMLVTAVFALSDSSWAVPVPGFMTHLAFAVLGLEIGLRFTRASLLHVRRVLPAASVMILAISAVCAGFGLLLSALADVSKVEGFLATTPGGLASVLAITLGTDANATFIVAVQLLRVVLMLLVTPLVALLVVSRE